MSKYKVYLDFSTDGESDECFSFETMQEVKYFIEHECWIFKGMDVKAEIWTSAFAGCCLTYYICMMTIDFSEEELVYESVNS